LRHARTFFQAITSQVIDLPGGNVGKPQGQVHLSGNGDRLAWRVWNCASGAHSRARPASVY
ncbi:hypothetical protein LLE59_08030, partial [Xanthomonas campestris]|uniref:hypothetical protein n=1 Tax=Xanthomonas campestris TaxID=339 RepID=UPI001E45779C